MKSVFWVAVSLIILVAAVLLIRTWLYPFAEQNKDAGAPLSTAVSEKAVEHLAGGLQIPTVSSVDYNETDFEPFDKFKTYLHDNYPLVYKTMHTDTVNGYGLVFHWPGQDKNLQPVLFLSHYDVVPVLDQKTPVKHQGELPFVLDDGAAGPLDAPALDWDYPAFSGAVASGRIYGRGALDMKSMLFALMESAETLIEQGFQPQRDIWLAFGHDEEVSGLHGAVYIAEHFQKMGLRFEAVYDEGGIITTLTPGGSPVALIGIGEKGYLTLRIKVRGVGGHSSMPPAKSSVVQAAEIINKLNTEQMAPRVIPPIADFLKNTGGEMPFKARLAIANQWLLRPVLLRVMASNPVSNALSRTTTAVSMVKGSDAPNVLPSVSEVTVNFRLLPGDTIEDVINHVKDICRDYETELEIVSQREASAISPHDTLGFETIKRSLAKVYPDVTASAYLTIGGTDSYKYQIVSDNIYRFMPVMLNSFEQRTIHNENEYISVDNYSRMINYFTEMMRAY